MHIALYFGSFNPIHHGHLIIANYVAQNTNANQVWLVVSPQNPLKPANSLLNEYNRLHLVQLAIDNEPNLQVSSIEFKLPKPSFTIDTLIYLKEKYPQHTFSIVIGSDSFLNIHKWKNFEQIISNYKIFVFLRPGFPIENAPNYIEVLNAPLLDISSTFVRNILQKKQSIKYLVPDAVQQEIERNRWYFEK